MASRRRAHSDDEDDEEADSVREGDRPKRKRTSVKASVAEGGDDEDGDESDGYQPGQRSTSKDKKGRKTKRKSDSEEGDDDDDGSASAQQDDMDDGAFDSDVSEFHDKYDKDMYIDVADRARMESLTEKERELEIARRHEEREAAYARWEIKRAMKLESRGPGRRRNKEREEKIKSINELKKKRQQKDQTDREAERRTVRERVERRDDDYKDDGGGDEEAFKALDGEVEVEDSRPANFEEIQSIRLSRNRLELWSCEPFFSEVVKGCFVRIGIGMHNNMQVYRLCQITGVKEGQTYSLGRTRTHFRLMLKHGPSERLFRMEMISNQSCSQSEYERWKKEMKDNNMTLPAASFVTAKAHELDEKRNYEHSAEDVKYIVGLKRKLGIGGMNPMEEKEEIKRKLDMAREGLLEEEIDVEALEEKYKEIHEASQAHHAKMHADIRGVETVNQRNKRIDAHKLDLSAKADAVEDVFTRKKTIPMLSRAPKTDETPKQEKLKPVVEQAKLAARESAEDLFEAHNVPLSIDHLLPPLGSLPGLSAAPPPVASSTASAAAGPGSSRLTLEEYKRRKGL